VSQAAAAAEAEEEAAGNYNIFSMNTAIIDTKFKEWTANLNPEEARISVFNHIRDIPYAIVPALRDPDVGTSGILEINKGSCQPKHFLLKLLFEKINIPIKYVSYPFKWQAQPLKFNSALKKAAEDLPFAYHLACKAYIGNQWILVDATYDPLLKNAGFPINENWDGLSDTKNAVTAEAEVIHENLQERIKFESEKRSFYSENEKIRYADFIEKFNFWLLNIRKA